MLTPPTPPPNSSNLGFKLLCVTDRNVIQAKSLDQIVSELAAHGLRALQIREKNLPDGEYENLVRQILVAVKNRPLRIFLNSRISLAKKYGSGLHLPDGSDIAGARKTLGPQADIGVSCHSLESAQTAEHNGASFILFGPVFSPISKSSAGAPLGLKAIEAVSKKVRLPVVAIGGITPNNAADCMNAGAAAVASVGALMETDDPKGTLAEFEKSLGGAL